MNKATFLDCIQEKILFVLKICKEKKGKNHFITLLLLHNFVRN